MRADSAELTPKLYSARGLYQVKDLQVVQPTLDKTKKLFQQRTVSRAQIPIVRGITSSNFEHRFDFGWGLFFSEPGIFMVLVTRVWTGLGH